MRTFTEAYAENWAWFEGQKPRPERYYHYVAEDYSRFVERILSGDVDYHRDVVRYLYRGFVWILRGAFSATEIIKIRERAIEYMRASESSFHQMREGSPDFHRIITPDEGLKYSFPCCKHSAYFYNWNDDPCGIRETVYARWRPMKVLMGMDADRYERNTPLDGVVDRIQVVRYPPGDGMLATHSDPFLHQRCFVSGIMSKRGTDYHGGGFYLIRANGEKEYLEPHLNVGDIVLGYATVHHGVDPCEGECDWALTDGRWFLSMYSNASDEVSDRHTGRAVK